MAYCLRSFVETLDQVLNPHKHYKNWVLDHDHRPQIQSLFENATFLQDFLDKSSPLIQETISSLEDRIMNAAEKAADTLETYITHQILLNPNDQNFTIIPPDFGEVIQTFEDAKQDVIDIEDVSQPSYLNVSPPVSSTRYPDSKNMVVGVEEDLNQLRIRLTSTVTELDIIPIIGMGGIGKTTLARILYDEFSSSRSHFDRCAWVTVSQSYDPQLILKTILACVTRKSLDELSQQETGDLITTVYRTLVGLRYLIVLDDIWNSKAWDVVQRSFARGNQGSRVIFTTRELTLGEYVKSECHEMHLLNEDKSWELLRRKVFGEESCPSKLEDVGKIIALKCGGLPLALQVIGGLLAHSTRSEEFWEYVAHNISSLIEKADDQFARIFSWSFTRLPHYLKPCFLYMGAFPEGNVIPASRIINLWVAEGFMYPIPNRSPEDAAEIHLNALVNRNLIFVRTVKKNGKPRSYGIHDLLRDLCLRKAQEMKFLFYVKESKTGILQEDILCIRRVSVHSTDEDREYRGDLKLTSLIRSLQLTGTEKSNDFVSHLISKSSLLRVLDVNPIYDFQEVFLHPLVNLRYLSSFANDPSTVSAISVLTNLRTLIVTSLDSFAVLKYLPQLRRLQFIHVHDENSFHSLEFYRHENLHCLSKIPLHNLTYLLETLPNLRKIGINIKPSYEQYDGVVDLTCFQKLKNLKLYNEGSLYNLSSHVIFPLSLIKLTLYHCKLSETLTAIGILPGLQVLKLHGCEFENSTWEPSKGEFCKLQYLEIHGSNLENWPATENHFPVLRHLVVQYCRGLTEIPSDIGEIETLENIELTMCKASVFDSARTLQQEQLDFGNTLQLQVGLTLEDFDNERAASESEVFESMVQNYGLTLHGLHRFSPKTVFPRSLKNMNLLYGPVNQTILRAMGVLPELETLKLKECWFNESTWESSGCEFSQLQHLEIEDARNLREWLATEGQFPVLQNLVLKKCSGLIDIPIAIRQIQTLEIIEVEECKDSVFDSARRLLEEQRKLGNTLLQLRLGRSIEDIDKERAQYNLK